MWEYITLIDAGEGDQSVVVVGGYPRGGHSEWRQILNAMGEEGWELVTSTVLVQPSPVAGSAFMYEYLFKRERSAPPSSSPAVLPKEANALAAGVDLAARFKSSEPPRVPVASGRYRVRAWGDVWGGEDGPDANVKLAQINLESELEVVEPVNDLFTRVRTVAGHVGYVHPLVLGELVGWSRVVTPERVDGYKQYEVPVTARRKSRKGLGGLLGTIQGDPPVRFAPTFYPGGGSKGIRPLKPGESMTILGKVDPPGAGDADKEHWPAGVGNMSLGFPAFCFVRFSDGTDGWLSEEDTSDFEMSTAG